VGDFFKNEKHYTNWFNKLAVDKYGKGITPKQKRILIDLWNTRYLYKRFSKFRLGNISNRISWEFKEFIKNNDDRKSLKHFFKEKETLLKEFESIIENPSKYEDCELLIKYTQIPPSLTTRALIEDHLADAIKITKNELNLNSLDIIESLTNIPGVYKLYNKNKKLIYVGRSFSLSDRLPTSIKERSAYYFSYITTKTNADATILEPYLITKYRPVNNVDCVTTDKPSFTIDIPAESDIFPVLKEKD
jgi:hypothetical protein